MEVPDILLMLSNDLVVFDNVLNQVFIITHIDPNTQSYEGAQTQLDNIIIKLQAPFSQVNMSNNKDLI
jgi:anthranilate synthase component 1